MSIPPHSEFFAPEQADEKARSGFTLTEVAIALGIVAFVLIPLLGLMSVGMGAGRHSIEDTVIAGLTKMVLTDLKTNSYSNLPTYSSTRIFDYSGKPTATNGYFSCSVSGAAHAATHPLQDLTSVANAVRVTLTFTWPIGAAKPNEETIETTVASY